MDTPEEHATARQLLGIGLVAAIGLTGLVLMFNETNVTDVTGQAFMAKRFAGRNPMIGCNANEVQLSAQGVQTLKRTGRNRYGPDWSPYTAARINFNGVGYCADAKVVRELLG